MSEERRIPCPECEEQIMPGAKKCPFCKEWLREKSQPEKRADSSSEEQTPKTSSKTKLLVFFAIIGLGITFGIYEYNAHKILSYADSIHEEGLYETSAMAYEKILEDYSLSIATVRANQQLEKVMEKEKDRIDIYKGSPRGGLSLTEQIVIKRRSQYRITRQPVNPPLGGYLFPLRTAQICTFLLLFLIGIKLNKGCPVGGTILLFLISGAFLIIQLVAYDKLDVQPLEETARELMKTPHTFFFISYAIIFFTGIAMLCNPKPNKN